MVLRHDFRRKQAAQRSSASRAPMSPVWGCRRARCHRPRRHRPRSLARATTRARTPDASASSTTPSMTMQVAALRQRTIAMWARMQVPGGRWALRKEGTRAKKSSSRGHSRSRRWPSPRPILQSLSPPPWVIGGRTPYPTVHPPKRRRLQWRQIRYTASRPPPQCCRPEQRHPRRRCPSARRLHRRRPSHRQLSHLQCSANPLRHRLLQQSRSLNRNLPFRLAQA